MDTAEQRHDFIATPHPERGVLGGRNRLAVIWRCTSRCSADDVAAEGAFCGSSVPITSPFHVLAQHTPPRVERRISEENSTESERVGVLESPLVIARVVDLKVEGFPVIAIQIGRPRETVTSQG